MNDETDMQTQPETTNGVGEQLHLAKELEPPGYNRGFEERLRSKHEMAEGKKRAAERSKMADQAVVDYAIANRIGVYNYTYDGKAKTFRLDITTKAKIGNAPSNNRKKKRPSDVTVELHVEKEKRKAAAKAKQRKELDKALDKHNAKAKKLQAKSIKRVRKALTEAQRDAKNAGDRARRAAQKKAKASS